MEPNDNNSSNVCQYGSHVLDNTRSPKESLRSSYEEITASMTVPANAAEHSWRPWDKIHQTYRVPVPLPGIPLSVSTIFPAKFILEKHVVLFSVILPGILSENFCSFSLITILLFKINQLKWQVLRPEATIWVIVPQVFIHIWYYYNKTLLT